MAIKSSCIIILIHSCNLVGKTSLVLYYKFWKIIIRTTYVCMFNPLLKSFSCITSNEREFNQPWVKGPKFNTCWNRCLCAVTYIPLLSYSLHCNLISSMFASISFIVQYLVMYVCRSLLYYIKLLLCPCAVYGNCMSKKYISMVVLIRLTFIGYSIINPFTAVDAI